MYVIIVYDVKQKRVNKVCKFLRQYLNWVQNSVFEGEVSLLNLNNIELKLKRIIEKKEDSIILYVFSNRKWVDRRIIGFEKNKISNII